MPVEFLEQLGFEPRAQQWMVRVDGSLATAWVYEDVDHAWLERVEAETRPWLGFAHPRVAGIASIAWHGAKLVIVTREGHGPSLLQAAHHLARVGIDREAWAVAEICAIGDALAAMARWQPGFVHRRPNTEQIVVVDGHAQLRAPIAHVAFDMTGYVGRGNALTSFRWMAPEQVRGAAVAPATDVYQLAVTLFAAIAGRHPIANARTDFELLKEITEGTAAPLPTANVALARVVAGGLARSIGERYRDPAEFVAALRGCDTGTPPASVGEALAAMRPSAGPAPSASPAIVGGRCQRSWDELAPTATDGIRHCASCDHEVVRVRSIAALIPLLGRTCVAMRDD